MQVTVQDASAKWMLHSHTMRGKQRDLRLGPEKTVGFLARIWRQDARRSKIMRQRAWVQRAWDGAEKCLPNRWCMRTEQVGRRESQG